MKMLICSDGSEAAEKAIRLGAAIADACNAEVTLLGIMETAEKADTILEALKRGQELLERHKIHAELITKTGQPVEEIAKRTEETSYDLVVIGAARKATSGRFWMSSKSYKIIKSIHPPVLVVLEKTETIKRVVVCSGGLDYIHTAVALTGQIARGMGASVTLFHVVPEPPAIYSGLHRMELNVDSVLNSKSLLGRNLRAEKEALEALEVPTEVRLCQGPVMDEIFQEIRQGNYDLVVAGSARSRSRLQTYMMGNITREIVNRSRCAVLIVRSPETPASPSGFKDFLSKVVRRTRVLKSAEGE